MTERFLVTILFIVSVALALAVVIELAPGRVTRRQQAEIDRRVARDLAAYYKRVQ